MTPTNPSPWIIPGIVARLCELHTLDGKQKLAFSEICDTLNREFGTKLTRNAIVGRVHRLKLAFRPSPLKRIAGMTKVRIDAPILPIEAESCSNTPLTILQLRDGDCHWPLGPIMSRPPLEYCGQASIEGRPYCEEHCRQAYNAPLARWS
jgi:GcrA cell cycle regulator